MACACKVNRQITYLQKKYGVNEKASKRSNVRGALKGFFKGLFIKMMLIPFLPFIALYVAFNGLFGHNTIKLDRLISK